MIGCGGSCNQGRASCDCELSNAIAPDPSRTFRPVYLDRPMSHWPIIIAAGLLLLGWLAGCIYYLMRK